MQLCLFEDDRVAHLRPLVNTRAAYDLRLGIRSLLETTRDAFAPEALCLHARSTVAPLMAHEYGRAVNEGLRAEQVLFVNGRYVAAPDPALDRIQRAVADNEASRVFMQGDAVVAAWMRTVPSALAEAVAAGQPLSANHFDALPDEPLDEAMLINRLWHLLDALRPALQRDFAARMGAYNILTAIDERPDTTVHASAVGVASERIYLAPGATVRPGAILNADSGPIYIDEQATIMEQAVVRGPAYIGPKSQVKVGANISGVAIGTWSKIGGEVHDAVLHSFSNKSHAGFLGHAYLGRWCNLGADTNNSNLKNDYGPVSLYNVATAQYESTGRQFAGLFMGDHAKTGINVMFNTGTVIGTFCNVYGGGLPPRYLPAFSWGGAEGGFTTYRLEKALRVAEAVMTRRDRTLTDAERAALTALFEATAEERERVLGP